MSVIVDQHLVHLFFGKAIGQPLDELSFGACEGLLLLTEYIPEINDAIRIECEAPILGLFGWMWEDDHLSIFVVI